MLISYQTTFLQPNQDAHISFFKLVFTVTAVQQNKASTLITRNVIDMLQTEETQIHWSVCDMHFTDLMYIMSNLSASHCLILDVQVFL